MKIKAKRILTLTLVLVMAFSLLSYSVMADEEEYTPTPEAFFATGGGNSILKTTINGNPYYIAYGAEEKVYYTSLDGVKWAKRYQGSLPVLRSLAYGGTEGREMAIGVAAFGTPTAFLFARDMAKVYENGTEPVSTVYNKVKDATGVWIELQPHIYYDSYSGLFFCHGLEYNESAEKTYTGLSLYYTDGNITKEMYNGNEVNALTWTKVIGDYTDGYDLASSKVSVFNKGRILIDGDGNGNILSFLATEGMNLNAGFTQVNGSTVASGDGRRVFSLIKVTKEGNTVSSVDAMYYSPGETMSAAAMLSNGKFALWSTKKTIIYVGDAKTCWTDNVISVTANSNKKTAEVVGIQGIEHDGSIYFFTGPRHNLYKGTIAANNTINLTDVGITSFIDAIDGESAATARGIEFDNNGNILLMTINPSKIYSVEVNESGIATKVTELSADATYDYIQNARHSSDTSVHGYRVDTGLAVRKNGVDGAAREDEIIFELISGNSDYFTAERFSKVSPETPAGVYDIKMRLTSKNQPSIFNEKNMTITVVPYYTASINSNAAVNEASSFTLTGSSDVIKVNFATEAQFTVESSKTYDSTLDNACVLAAVYDKVTGEMKQVVTTYANTDITTENGTECTINVSGNAGDTVKLFVWKNRTTIVPVVNN